jgi:RNA polymerase sigma factor (sigma-70 family)
MMDCAGACVEWRTYIYAFCRKRLWYNDTMADDATQEVFLKAHRFWHRETFASPTHILRWLLMIARNVVYDTYRRERLRAHRSLSTFTEEVDESAWRNSGDMERAELHEKLTDPRSVEANMLDRVAAEDALRALGRMPAIYRDIMVLPACGYTDREIAARAGYAPASIRARRFKIRAALAA